MGAEMSELRPGLMGAFDYADDQSAKTAISWKTAKTYKFDAVSKFTAGSDESMGWGSDASQGGENDEDGMTGVQFELPEGGIGNNKNECQTNDGRGSNEDDAISINSGDLPAPSNLNDKFGDTMDTEETKEDDKMEEEEDNDTQRDGAKNNEAAKPQSNKKNTPAGNALQHALSTIEALKEQIRLIEASTPALNKNSGAEVHADDAATNVSTDIDPTSGSRGSPREGGDYENTSSNEVKTQGASGMDNDPSPAG